jgi:predicted dehydrogenase
MLSAVVIGCGATSVRRLQAAQKVQDLKVVGLVDIDEALARARGSCDWARIVSALRLASFTRAMDIAGRHEPVYREHLEATGQVHALNDFKDCRGSPRFIGAPA